jgi:2-hydroxy-3-keto-5-methylthiopentenyl-1-phosphate phosphatase
MGVIKDLDATDVDEDDEDDYGQPLNVRSTCYSLSSRAVFSSGSTVAILSSSESSELPYLRDSVSSLSMTSVSSSSFGSFNDLLASVERKYFGTEWGDIGKFSAGDESDEHGLGGIGDREQWSDVFCLEEYA